MKRTTKLLAVLLAAVMLFTVCPAFAADTGDLSGLIGLEDKAVLR